ncbi:uncharacterized protein LOC125716057 isoform X2 [Brienomyrus brachyistius]|uniref:uncharacterized protein LOC125716057 isoform X2 n=1 Tax=Brienomyrus brachyistius TaxID=42636 RepID=UPI0020B3A661|nr:uncharacterized protein LOC125716057 isoform X2 [Brienomyrus brachyistius]
MPVMSKPGFLAKTDSGLRRLFSEEVWSWGKEKKGGEAGLMEPDVLQGIRATQPGYPKTSPRSLRKHDKSEETLQSKEGTLQQKHKPMKTMDDSTETDPANGGQAPQQTHICLQEKRDSREKSNGNVSSGDESSSTSASLTSSSSSSYSGRPLRIRSLPNSPDGSWRSQKTVGSFASLPEFQRAVAICINVSEVSVSSSDIDEDLPFDLEDSKCKYQIPCSKKNCVSTMGTSSDLCIECKIDLTSGNTVSCNRQNYQRLENVPSININLGGSTIGAGANQCLSLVTCAGGDVQQEHEQEISSVMASHFHSSSVQDTCDGDIDISHESSSADEGPLDTEEKSEAFSHSSECLVSSGDEMVFNNELGNGGDNSNLDMIRQLESADFLSSEQSNFFRYKKKQLFLDIDPISLEKQMLGQKSGINNPVDFPSWNTLVSEETLSEILSPVDEILSYGSAELLPSLATVTGSDMGNYVYQPPPPASEIITWTSEEDFVLPLEGLEKIQPNKSPTEDPSIISEDLPSLSEDFLFLVNQEESNRQTDKAINHEDLKSDLLITNSETTSSYKKLSDNNRCKTRDKNPLLDFIISEAGDAEGCSERAFSVGEGVVFCHSVSSQWKDREMPAFSGGNWAGVSLDSPTRNHNGTFKDMEYFKCGKNCGIFVRAEDILHEERERDLESTLHNDPFSDEEPPSDDKKEKIWRAAKYSGDTHNERKHISKKPLGCDSSGAKMTCKDVTPLQEPNNNTCSELIGACDHLLSETPSDQLQQSIDNTTLNKFALSGFDGLKSDHFHQKTTYPSNAEFSECVKGQKDLLELCANKTNPILVSPIESFIDQTSLKDFAPGVAVQEVQHDNSILDVREIETVRFFSKCHHDLNSLVEKLAGDLIKEILTDAQEFRRRSRRRRSFQNDSQIIDRIVKKREDNLTRANQLEFSDQWQCTLSSSVNLKIQPHDPMVIRHLVAAAVERLCGQTISCKVDITDAPDHLIDGESRRSYQQVIYDLTSEVFEEISRDHPTTCGFPWQTNQALSLATLQPSKSPLTHVKAAVQNEVQRVLNLERNDVQLREMLQVMCKYGNTQRDKVDYILDTMSILNKIYAAPSNVNPPAIQASEPAFGQREQDYIQ